MDNNIGWLLQEREGAGTLKFKNKTNKIKKVIRKAIVLNELEKERAKGIRRGISSVFAFLNSGEPKLPILRDDSDLDQTLGEKFIKKLIELPISLLMLPLVAMKMGINAAKLKKWLNEKYEINHTLKTQQLFDNIERFTNEQKKFFHMENPNKYIDHVLSDYRQFPGEYNELINGMADEFKTVKSNQLVEDQRYARYL